MGDRDEVERLEHVAHWDGDPTICEWCNQEDAALFIDGDPVCRSCHMVAYERALIAHNRSLSAALEKVRREAWVSGMVNAANIIGRMKVEDRKQWVVLDAAQDLIRAAIRGDDT